LMVSHGLAESFASYEPSSILELGCGAGRNLVAISNRLPEVKIAGVEINPAAVQLANAQFKGQTPVSLGNLYSDLSAFADDSMDIVFTCGVLMHVPHDKVVAILRQMHRIARRAVIHFELHGPSNSFDFHRYPRNYKELYLHSDIQADLQYEIYPPDDFRSSGTRSYNHALLVAEKVSTKGAFAPPF
jgi:ubiquinone/menaquinone biosynthesis C-methylase UbiE